MRRELARKLLSSPAALDTAEAAELVGVPSVALVTVTGESATNTARQLRLRLVLPSGDTLRLFMKMSGPRPNGYQEMSLREAGFYQLAARHGALPIPRCYGTYLDRECGEFVLTLQDVGDTCRQPEANDFQSRDVWLACARSLAAFHAAFWESPEIGRGELAAMGGEELEQTITENRTNVERFIERYGAAFDRDTAALLCRANALNDQIIRESSARIRLAEAVTVCNGDSHLHNFMLPRKTDAPPCLLDFQFYGAGFGTGDLAHLTRVGFPAVFRKTFQMELLRAYYDGLAAHGVRGYPWRQCVREYRMAVASMVLIPVWQATAFGVDTWVGTLSELCENYRVMDCDSLL